MIGPFKKIARTLGLTAQDAVACLVSVPTMALAVAAGLSLVAVTLLVAGAYAATLHLGRS